MKKKIFYVWGTAVLLSLSHQAAGAPPYRYTPESLQNVTMEEKWTENRDEAEAVFESYSFAQSWLNRFLSYRCLSGWGEDNFNILKWEMLHAHNRYGETADVLFEKDPAFAEAVCENIFAYASGKEGSEPGYTDQELLAFLSECHSSENWQKAVSGRKNDTTEPSDASESEMTEPGHASESDTTEPADASDNETSDGAVSFSPPCGTDVMIGYARILDGAIGRISEKQEDEERFISDFRLARGLLEGLYTELYDLCMADGREIAAAYLQEELAGIGRMTAAEYRYSCSYKDYEALHRERTEHPFGVLEPVGRQAVQGNEGA